MHPFLQQETVSSAQKAKADPNRLSFHMMPLTGWINDPNGLHQKDGIHHIFYQYTPGSPDGNDMRGWGHMTTKDFVHYVQEIPAVFPGDPMDLNGAYSGGALVDGDQVRFYYTGNGKLKGDHDYIHSGRLHWTVTFLESDGFPIKTEDKQVLMKNEDYPDNLTCHVRDPYTWKENGQYYMVQGARTNEDVGQVNVFTADDGLHFKPHSVLSSKKPFGYMWECPNLFSVDGKRILLICPQGVKQDGYKYENVYQNGYYFVENSLDEDQTLDGFQELDKGFDFYAPQVYVDENGRTILIGWMGMPDAPYSNAPTIEYGWQHALTLPRKLFVKGDRLYQYPLEELEALRLQEIPLDLKAHEKLELSSPAFELHLDFDDKPFVLTIRKDAALSWNGSLLTLDMGKSGEGRTQRHLEIDKIYTLDLFSDTSSLEIFVNGGQYALTTRIYDDKKDLTLSVDQPVKGRLYYLKPIEVEMGYLLPEQQSSSH